MYLHDVSFIQTGCYTNSIAESFFFLASWTTDSPKRTSLCVRKLLCWMVLLRKTPFSVLYLSSFLRDKMVLDRYIIGCNALVSVAHSGFFKSTLHFFLSSLFFILGVYVVWTLPWKDVIHALPVCRSISERFLVLYIIIMIIMLCVFWAIVVVAFILEVGKKESYAILCGWYVMCAYEND